MPRFLGPPHAKLGAAGRQEVYGGLEEPDGLAGLVRLRRGGPCPADTRLAAEKAGAWSEALYLHEQVTPPPSLPPRPRAHGTGVSPVLRLQAPTATPIAAFGQSISRLSMRLLYRFRASCNLVHRAALLAHT